MSRRGQSAPPLPFKPSESKGSGGFLVWPQFENGPSAREDLTTYKSNNEQGAESGFSDHGVGPSSVPFSISFQPAFIRCSDALRENFSLAASSFFAPAPRPL